VNLGARPISPESRLGFVGLSAKPLPVAIDAIRGPLVDGLGLLFGAVRALGNYSKIKNLDLCPHLLTEDRCLIY
jgi:hypothetical protein